MLEQLLNIVFEDGAVSCTLKHSRQQYPVLCVCWQYLAPLPTLVSGDLHRRRTERRPPCPPEPDSLITSRLIYIDKMAGAKG